MRFKRVRRGALVGVVACASLLSVANAQGDTAVLGSDLTAPNFSSAQVGALVTLSQATLPGRLTSSPISGTVVNWKVIGALGGPLMLQVIHPDGGGLFTSTGTAVSGPITGPGVLSFNSNLRIQVGDRVGVEPSATTDQMATTPIVSSGPSYDIWNPLLIDNEPGRAPTANTNRELGMQATVVTDCQVPNLRGLKLGAAQSVLGTAGCSPGNVTPTSKKARKKKKFVVGQSIAPGTTVVGLTPVDLRLGRKPKK